MAKLCGVRVEAFSVGFGPRLFGFKYGETDYKICLLPLGGYVKMAGEAAEQNLEVPGKPVVVQAYEKLPGVDARSKKGLPTAYNPVTLPNPSLNQKVNEWLEDDPKGGDAPAVDFDPANDPGSLLAHPRWQRMLIGLAGPAVNLLLTLVLMFVYYAFINEVPAVTVPTTNVEWVTPGSPAAQAGIQTGDVIQSFAGINNPSWEPQIFEKVKLSPGQNVPVVVSRGGQTIALTFHVPTDAKKDDFDIGDTGLQPQYFAGPITVASVLADSGAEHGGLRAGDQIAAVDGHALHSVYTLLAYMQWDQGKPMVLTLLRKGAPLQITATPTKHDTSWRLGFTPEPPQFRDAPLTFSLAEKKSLLFFKSNSLLVADVLKGLFTHRLSVSQLMGQVGIAQVAGEAAEVKGWLPKFDLASEISLQLGIMNLLPFPILDGGMVLLLLIESGLRHDISLAIKERIYTAAFVMLVAFFAFVLFNDVNRLGVFGHLRP
ncbi:MAG: site-2 protease family protein [Terracidiphilus sp.]